MPAETSMCQACQFHLSGTIQFRCHRRGFCAAFSRATIRSVETEKHGTFDASGWVPAVLVSTTYKSDTLNVLLLVSHFDFLLFLGKLIMSSRR